MTFSRAKASWSANRDSPTAAHMAVLDGNQAKAVDAAGGGEYAPSNPIQINGSGIGSNNLTDITVTGVLQRASDGRWLRRMAMGDILEQAATQILDMEYDVWFTTMDHDTQNITLHLAVTTGQTPVVNDVISVVRTILPSVAKTFIIYSEEAPGAPVASFPTALTSQTNELCMGRFFFTGATWVPLFLSCDVT